jgi:hypothetical protein
MNVRARKALLALLLVVCTLLCSTPAVLIVTLLFWLAGFDFDHRGLVAFAYTWIVAMIVLGVGGAIAREAKTK